MSKINWTALQRDVQRQIDEDPWEIDVHRRGRTPADPELTFRFTGRISPHGARGLPLSLSSPDLAGEAPAVRYSWVLLVPAGIQALMKNDTVYATQEAHGVQRTFDVFYGGVYAYKQEVIIDERQ